MSPRTRARGGLKQEFPLFCKNGYKSGVTFWTVKKRMVLPCRLVLSVHNLTHALRRRNIDTGNSRCVRTTAEAEHIHWFHLKETTSVSFEMLPLKIDVISGSIQLLGDLDTRAVNKCKICTAENLHKHPPSRLPEWRLTAAEDKAIIYRYYNICRCYRRSKKHCS